jgi:hypothetical protein
MNTTDPRAESALRNRTPQPPPYFSPELRYSVPEAAALLRQSVSRTWADIASGKLTPLRDGGRVYIPGTEIRKRCSLPQTTAA